MTAGPFLTVEEIAELLRCSRRVIHGLTANSEIPHRKLKGQRRCLFVRAEVERWVRDQPELDVIELERGGRIVRIKGSA